MWITCVLKVLLFYHRYDPYEKKFTEEFYDHMLMRKQRNEAISLASQQSRFGLILGTLGRQGSTKVLDNVKVPYEYSFLFMIT